MEHVDPSSSIAFQVEDRISSLELDESKSVKIGPHVSTKEKNILRKYIDVFACKPSDLTCISPQLIIHKLNVFEHIKPVQ